MEPFEQCLVASKFPEIVSYCYCHCSFVLTLGEYALHTGSLCRYREAIVGFGYSSQDV